MEVPIVDREGMGRRVMAYNGDAEPSEGGEAINTEHHSSDGEAEPQVGMLFDSDDAAKAFYDEYANRVGFSSKPGHITRSRTDGATVARDFLCSREGSKRRSSDSCEAMLKIELQGHGKWVVTKFIKDHSHSMMSPGKVHYIRPRRHFAGASKTTETCQVGAVPGGVMYVSVDGNRVESNHGQRNASTPDSNRVARNAAAFNFGLRPNTLRRTLGRDAQNMLDYFKKMQAENPCFFYAIQLDEDNRMANVFWADSRSRTAYSHFGDAITLDTNFRYNQYRVPFAPFTGVNHHGQSILFGCAILLDDSEASFVWLLRTFLTAMNDRHPVSIVTDQDRAIQTAVSLVLPETRHYISKWHVLRESQDKLVHVCHAHPNFQADLYNCINLTETVEEFESSWNLMLDKYDLRTHDWLQSLYDARAHWVPVYFRDTFFAALSPHQGFDGSFFDGYVNQQTTLPFFFRQYERALENSFEKELEADFDTICTTPVLRTPSPMENQAAQQYTRKIFAKFQEELVETFVYTANKIEGDGSISTFRVAKFEDDNRAYIVTLNYSEKRANCSCKMFEYSGILCRHILTVFTVTNVLTLPSHYILNRWTRNAKNSAALFEHSGELHGQDSFTVRYNNLCQEGIKYAEEGATALDTYNVAISALREGGRKVASVKKTIAKIPPPSPHVGGISHDDRKTATSASDATPLLWPRQDEVIRRFNLNDLGAANQSVTDLNLPRMAPVSLHRDDGPPGNMVCKVYLSSRAPLPLNLTRIANCAPVKCFQLPLKPAKSSPDYLDATHQILMVLLLLNDVILLVFSLQPKDGTWHFGSKWVHILRVKGSMGSILKAILPCLKSMTWVMENKNSAPGNRVAVINLKLQDYSKTSSTELEVKFQLSRVTLEPMLRSMAYISEQLSAPANKVALINLKLQDTETASGESEVKFQVSRDTLGAMLRSMAYIREQLSNTAEPPQEPSTKKQRK